jgi:hypothetical protein
VDGREFRELFDCLSYIFVWDTQNLKLSLDVRKYLCYSQESYDGYELKLKYCEDTHIMDRLCGLVVRVPGYRFRGPDSIPGGTRFSEK